MDLNSLVVFAKVVEANSFSEAARRLRMPITTGSRRHPERAADPLSRRQSRIAIPVPRVLPSARLAVLGRLTSIREARLASRPSESLRRQ